MHFHYRVTFTGYSRCFYATTSHGLVTLTFDLFDLDSVSCTALLVSDPHTNFYYPTTIGYWVTSTEYLITFPLSETVTAHAPCHVTSNRGQKLSTFLKSLTPICLFTLSLSGRTTKLKPCYRQKIAFSYYEGYKVYCACAVSRDLCLGGPPKPHVTIFWPRISYLLYNFYATTMTIKGSLYLSIPMLKQFRSQKSSQNRSPKWRFSEI